MAKIDGSLRDSADYRRQRLEEERHRLNRRMLWTAHKKDEKAVARLDELLEGIEDAIDDSLTPGRDRGRKDWAPPSVMLRK